MAFWVLGTGASGPSGKNSDVEPWHQQHQQHQHHHHHHHNESSSSKAFQSPLDLDHHGYDSQHHHHAPGGYLAPRHAAAAPPSIQIKNLAFLVIREQHPDSPPPPETCADNNNNNNNSSSSSHTVLGKSSFTHTAAAPQRPTAVERTESGLAISDDSASHGHDDNDQGDELGGPFLEDLAAAQLVRDHVAAFHRRCPDSQHARILRALINPKCHHHPRASSRSRSRRRAAAAAPQKDHPQFDPSNHPFPNAASSGTSTGASTNAASSPSSSSSSSSPASSAAFPLDNDALRSVFSAANELFFANRLARRVAWDWSHPGSAQYRSAVVGTTALRRCAHLGGWETLIVLSSPVLRDTRYNRRLLLSTFLHEMIHSFLFVTCGRKAGRQGGHTEGFRQIAEVIDAWVGKEYLRLSDMEADLKYFEDGTAVPATPCMGYRQMMHQRRGGNGSGGGPEPPRRDTFPPWQLDSKRNVWPQHAGGAGSDAAAAGHGLYLNEPVVPPPPQYRHPNDGAWQWYEREGFAARDGPPLVTPY